MAFDENLFPLKVAYGSSGGPTFSTDVVTLGNGFERRNQNWCQARRKYDAKTGVRTALDAAMLSAFFQARCGRARGFRLKDWADFTSSADGTSSPKSTDQWIGTGDGGATTFQLIKTYGNGEIVHRREIRKPVSGSVLLAINGISQASGWSVDATSGTVTFAAPPAAGLEITAGFHFDVPVRFDTDRLSATFEDNARADIEVPIIEIRV